MVTLSEKSMAGVHGSPVAAKGELGDKKGVSCRQLTD